MKITRKQLRKLIKEEIEVAAVESIPTPHHDEHRKDDGEVGMAINQLQAISATAIEVSDMVRELDYIPEWGDGKVATVLDRLNSIRSHLLGKSVGQVKGGYEEIVSEQFGYNLGDDEAYMEAITDFADKISPVIGEMLRLGLTRDDIEEAWEVAKGDHF